VRQARGDIEAIGATAIAVGGSAPHQARALAAEGSWFPCLLDPQKRVYDALDLGFLGFGLLNPIGCWRYLRGFFRGARQGRVSDPNQAPGVAILDARGVARWIWRGSTVADYPRLPEALARLKSMVE
jgi:hypothetical protein